MLEMTGEGDYADVLERALYNGTLSGISLSGDHYFYANPLESRGTHARTPWFTCACCPPNIARLIGSVGHYVAGVCDDAFYVHTPVGFDASATFNGVRVEIKLESEYPWSGRYKVEVKPEVPVEFSLYLRIPAWSGEMEIDFPNTEEPADYDRGYAVLTRTWKPGDVLTIDLGMEPKWVEADPRVRDNLGRVALTNGPLIYALEETDLGYAPQLFSADIEAPILVKKETKLEGLSVLCVEGLAVSEGDSDDLYSEAGSASIRDASATLVPYYAWCNRGPTNMQVWIRQI
jgi:DUF1680 family protein